MIKINYDVFFKIKYPQRIAIINVIAKKPGTGVGVRGTGGDVTGGGVTGGDVTDGVYWISFKAISISKIPSSTLSGSN
jgi:hypothetical protein